jgi:hypothetical protein
MVEKLEKERKIRNFTEVEKLDVYKVWIGWRFAQIINWKKQTNSEFCRSLKNHIFSRVRKLEKERKNSEFFKVWNYILTWFEKFGIKKSLECKKRSVKFGNWKDSS